MTTLVASHRESDGAASASASASASQIDNHEKNKRTSSSGGNNDNTVPSQKTVQVARNSSNAAPATVMKPQKHLATNATSGAPKHGGKQDAYHGHHRHQSHGAGDAEIKEVAEGQPVCDLKERERLQKLLASSHKNRRGNIDFYTFGKVVGVGSFGKVRIAWHKLTGQAVAIKTYDKTKVKDQIQLQRIQMEIRVMENLNHALIVRHFEAVESPSRVHIIMEILRGGSLCSYVKRNRQLDENESRQIFLQIVDGLEYMHARNIVHRDIKLEVCALELFSAGVAILCVDFD